MNKQRVSVVPVDESAVLFKDATISVVQIGHDHIPDYDPDLLDRALIRLQTAMLGKLRRGLNDVRAWLDWPPAISRRELGVPLSSGEPSDASLAAVLIRDESPFGIQYDWAPGAVPIWPDGFCLVLWRGDLYERHGDLLKAWSA